MSRNILRTARIILGATMLAALAPTMIQASPGTQSQQPTVAEFIIKPEGGGIGAIHSPSIADGKVVYEYYEVNDIHGIELYDLAARKTGIFYVSVSPHETTPATDGKSVVWVGRQGAARFGGPVLPKENVDIYLKPVGGGAERQLTTAPDAQVEPAIAGSIVVWTDYRGAKSDDDLGAANIYMYNLTTNQETPVSTAPNAQQSPATNGKVVVWGDRRNDISKPGTNLPDVNSDIYGYDTITKQEFPVVTAKGWQGNPAISGNIIVWEDWRGGVDSGSAIYGYDLSTKKEFLISAKRGVAKGSPKIWGSLVVWEEIFQDGLDPIIGIVGYDLNTKQQFSISSDHDGPVNHSPVVDGNTVVWVDDVSEVMNPRPSVLRAATISGIVITPPATVISRTFPETGKSISGLFLSYWDAHGGLPQQGYPISGVMTETSELDGKQYQVQYFERAVFEEHPETQDPNFRVLLSQLGTFQYQQKYPSGAPNQNPNTTSGSLLFKETGKRLGGAFLEYWQKNGGLMQQGYPISDEFMEVSALDGKTYRVQYFERAVFELHPENKPPYDVLLSQLGTFRYKEKYGSGK